MKNLQLKTVNELLGENFFIPHYQRGYRWTDHQVNDLLNDIWAFSRKSLPKDKEREFYCLQPIVVKDIDWERLDGLSKRWEVVDGQQRLTTIYIILSYLTKEHIKEDNLIKAYGRELFAIQYETRKGSETFLKDIKDNMDNIDYYHMSQAYNTVRQWFTSGQTVKDRSDRELFLSTLLGKSEDRQSVQVIWYKAGQDVHSQDLFTRLNIGKIPLTNAELIKALFLSSSSFKNEIPADSQRIKIEISLFWDEIEQRLANDDFWSFITNRKQTDYANKIELLFDMIAGKTNKNTDPLFTFLYFHNKAKENNNTLRELWQKIRLYDQTLIEWFSNRNLYHKIGYLITVENNLGELIKVSLASRKDAFEAELDNLIRKSVYYDLEKLYYDKNRPQHNKSIEKVLMLFNIESIRCSQNLSDRYPFKYHKAENWSLEHIHAQNSESLDRNKKGLWMKWLSYHESLMNEVIEQTSYINQKQILSELITEVMQLSDSEDKLTWEKFTILSERIVACFSERDDQEMDEMHGIGNLALLGMSDNSALNNSVFEVKRREIIKIDKSGSYIPICTRRVFLRYYSPVTAQEHDYMWSADDRKSYFQEIKSVLSNYLPVQQSTEVQ